MESQDRKAFVRQLSLVANTVQDLKDALQHYSDVAEPTAEHLTQLNAWNNSLRSLRDLVRTELSKSTRAGALL